MAVTVFKSASFSLSGLISRIEHGEIALPDLQRPFVWTNVRVRNLFDSMYRGFPVGYLLLWSTGADATARQIGTEERTTVPSMLIVDGQQRLTSLYAVLTGKPVVRKDFTKGRIRVAFRPSDHVFEVTDAAVENDPEFIPDISVVFEGSFLSFVNRFLDRLEAHRGETIDDAEKDRLVESIDRLKDIQNYPFQTIELDRGVDEEAVAEVFVRINSQGVQLNHADFILTLMSVFWEQGRRDLEAFCLEAKTPSRSTVSPFNHFVEPSPDQLLRTAVGVAFRRGRLQYVYSILRGKDLETGEFSPERREAQFAHLQDVQSAALDLTNWHEFLKCLQHAGFRSSRMVSSQTAVYYVYVIWLIGRCDFGVDLKRLRSVIARWWFMAHTTRRYSGSSETQLEADLGRISALEAQDADAFCALLDRIVRDTFTSDYWSITLPNLLDTAASKSPPLLAYWAALNLLEAEALFSETRVSTLLDPVVTPQRGLERHHLFPKAYLEREGIKGTRRVSAIANMAFVDWTDNASAADRPPAEYWPAMTEDMSPDRVSRQSKLHALPAGWEQMAYDEFCERRRGLISEVVREGFEQLWERSVADAGIPTIEDLIADGESNMLEFKESARWSHGTEAKGKSEQIIVKTVAGFMNADGGTLIIGVADDGATVGIESDYETLSKGNRDGFELFLTQLLQNSVSGPAPSLCRVRFHELDDRDVCEVKVAASAKPVFAAPVNSKKPTDFWVRQGNRTVQLHGPDLSEYMEERWG